VDISYEVAGGTANQVLRPESTPDFLRPVRKVLQNMAMQRRLALPS
jgi:hypothetical protein